MGEGGGNDDGEEDARRGIMLDERFVLDERGDVRDAQGYEGDVDAGLARWKAEGRSLARVRLGVRLRWRRELPVRHRE